MTFHSKLARPGCGQALPDAEPIMPDVLKVLRHLSRTPWPEIRGLQLRQSTQRALESILHRYLVYVLERRLKSADFLNRLRLLPAAGTEAAVRSQIEQLANEFAHLLVARAALQ